MSSRPLLKIEKLNPALFKFVVELREVKVRFAINNEVEIQVCKTPCCKREPSQPALKGQGLKQVTSLCMVFFSQISP